MDNGLMARLNEMSVTELTALRDAAEAKRLEKLDAAKAEVLAETRAKLAALGLTLEAALLPNGGEGKRKASSDGEVKSRVPAKYRGPNGEEWSGRGKAPKWLMALEVEGRKREEFSL